MGSIKNSTLLDELIQEAKKIGKAGVAPFTAERFIVAIIDKLNAVAPELRSPELQMLEGILSKTLQNLDNAKSVLLQYIYDNGVASFIDDLYMKNMLRAAAQKAQSDNVAEIDGVSLLNSIFYAPSESLKKIIAKVNDDTTSSDTEESASSATNQIDFESLSQQIYSSASGGKKPEEDPETKDTEPEEEKLSENVLSDLIADVKRIRTELKSVVFGQDNAINVFTSGYFQSRILNMTDKKRSRPAASFLFAGSPGVGKTFLAESIAACLKIPHRTFDMSEYAEREAAYEFIGSDNIYRNSKKGNLTGFVADNPKCVLIFDEIEKAHISIIHLFLQILDAGRVRDSNSDDEISFRDAIIIMTTNAGKQLYEDSELLDLSSMSRKVIIRALQTDMDPRTQAPFFPAPMCSRFASGNVVMFNHMCAHDLVAIAKKEMLRHAENFEKTLGIKTEFDEEVFAALLFSEGASVDARTIRGRAETFFNGELYELLRLVSSEKSKAKIEDIHSIRVSVDLDRTTPEIKEIFEGKSVPKILVVSSEKNAEQMAAKVPDAEYYSAQSCEKAIEIVKKTDINLVLLDVRFGANAEESFGLNIEDAYTPAREFLNYLRTTKNEAPIYILENETNGLTHEEKVSFLGNGIRDIISLSEPAEVLKGHISYISAVLHRQASMTSLARQNKLIAFSTSQNVTSDGNAEIKLFDFHMEVAIDSEDSKNVLSSMSKPNIHFDDVIGASDAKKELKEFINYLQNPKQYAGTGLRPPKGVLLYGPPGTGKTMLAKAMACEADMTFIAAEGNQFLKKYVGEGSEALHKIFKTARKYAPTILFIDEIEAIAKERRGNDDGHGSAAEDTLTSLLTEMDGFSTDSTKPVFVIAATNFDVTPGNAKSLDQAFLRRFDRRIYIDLPGKNDRIRFLQMKRTLLKAFSVSDEAIENLAIRSTGMSLAALDSVVDFALRITIREGKTQVTDEILDEAFETFNYGESKKINNATLERVARHEAGHALLCYLSGENPSYLTVVSRGNHGGYMKHGDNEDKGIYTRDDILAEIRTSLGGRAAEIVCYGENDGISTGAASDLAHATALATGLVCRYGMYDDFGLAVFNSTDSPEVRAIVNKILREQMSESIRILTENRVKLDVLVSELLSKNSLAEEEIVQILAD